MTKDRSGNRSRRWCAAPIPETPAPTMRTSTWPPSSTCSVSGAFTGDVVVMVRAYVAIAGIRDCRSLLRFPEPRRGGWSDGQATRRAAWRSGPANGWHDELIWYAAAIHQMRALTPGYDDF